MYPHKSQPPHSCHRAQPADRRDTAAGQPGQTNAQHHRTIHTPGASGQASNVRSLVTPDPLPSGGLTYKPGDIITGYQPGIMSETKRPGQSTEWTVTDADTVYKFEKRVVAKTYHVARSGDLAESVTHNQIVSTPNGPPDALGRQWGVNTLVYTLQDLQFKMKVDGNLEEGIRVPKGTLCCIQKLTTRKSGEAGGRVYNTVTPNQIHKYLYILEAKVEISRWENVTCTIRKEVSNFVALTPLEKRAYNSSILPPKKVIPYNA